MVQFLLKRFIGLLFVVLAVTFITFIFGYWGMHVGTGDPIKAMLGTHFDKTTYERLLHEYHLDLPWYQQYFDYIGGLLQGNFGLSIQYPERPVLNILLLGIPYSAELGFWGFTLTLVLGIPLGILSALKANTWIDTTNQIVALTLYAVPSFVLAVFFQVIVVQLDKATGGVWPVANWGHVWQYSWQDIQFKLGPILVYAAVGFAYFTRFSRTTMMEVLRQDYVRTARAKGLRESIVVYRHALRNAMIPLVTVIGLSIGLLITGVFFVEQIFNIPGIGIASLTAIINRDYGVIQATTILFAVCVVLGNLLSDVLYTVVDPRIRIV